MYYDKEMDEELNIETIKDIDWPRGVNLDYFRTESTSYADLDHFIDHYSLLEDAQLVDYGSGKGRIIFYMNHVLGIPTTGIEVNMEAFVHLEQNLEDYEGKFPERTMEVTILEQKAEEYDIKEKDNIFYFFNPFTVHIFKQVVLKILMELKEKPRVADIILYYPNVSYVDYLEKQTPFHLVQTIKNRRYAINNRECFKIFRYIP